MLADALELDRILPRRAGLMDRVRGQLEEDPPGNVLFLGCSS
jgi:hypothetical protein